MNRFSLRTWKSLVAFAFTLPLFLTTLAQDCENEVLIVLTTSAFGSEISWDIQLDDVVVLASNQTYASNSAYTALACLADGCYTFNMYDSFGDGWNGGIVTLLYQNEIIGLGSGEGSWSAFNFGVNSEGCADEVVLGCTIPNACNYNPDATFNDQTCTYPGCTNPESPNYNSQAGCDDGSCLDPDCGTLVTISLNAYTDQAVAWSLVDDNGLEVADGYLEFPNTYLWETFCLEDGCYTFTTDINQVGADSTNYGGYIYVSLDADGDGVYDYYTSDQYSSDVLSVYFPVGEDCGIVWGCLDPYACNYDTEANYNNWDCTYPGCTDPGALNYQAWAGCDDGSCEYPEPCDGNELLVVMIDSFGDGWNGGDYRFFDEFGNLVVEGTLQTGSAGTDVVCLPDGCYLFTVSGGSFPSEISWEVLSDGALLASGGAPATVAIGLNTDGDCTTGIGCTVSTACNYDSTATTDDGSCTYPGCTDSTAQNYDPYAGCDDGSCFGEDCGTVVVAQLNLYTQENVEWSLTNADGLEFAGGTLEFPNTYLYDEFCLPDGCYTLNTDVAGWGSDSSNWGGYIFISFDYDGDGYWDYYSSDQTEQGDFLSVYFPIGEDCGIVWGCLDPNACNYNSEATYNDWNCTYPGCTDPEALNYQAWAGCDDGSCEYPEPCDENQITVMMYDSFGDGWNNGTYQFIDEEGNVVAEGTLAAGNDGADVLCLPDGCYAFSVTGGFFPSEITWEILSENEVLASGAAPAITSIGLNSDGCVNTFGCTSSEACNYDSSATIDDGSCTYPGCTDPNALNYDPSAGCDDGSCDLCEDGVVAMLYVCTFANGQEVELDIVDSDGNVVFEVNNLGSSLITYFDVCLDPTECYTVNMYNNTNTGWYGGYFWINALGVQVAYGALQTGETEGQVIFTIAGEGCFDYGCTNPGACNYDSEANADDGSCTYPGCMDPDALNYDPEAGCEGDEACEYPVPCDNNLVYIYMYDSFGDGWNGGMYTITTAGGELVAEGSLVGGTYGLETVCLEDGCYIFSVDGDTFPGEVSWQVISGDVALNGGSPFAGVLALNSDCEDLPAGCTDPQACNYDPQAQLSDDSCTYPGCTNADSPNYDPEAGCDDGSCILPVENDLCANPTFIEPGTYAISNIGAYQNEGFDGECWAYGAGEDEQTSIWFSFTTPDEPATITLETFGDGTNSFTDTQFGLYLTCDDEEALACDGNSGYGLFAAFYFQCGDLEPNTTYLLQIDGYYGDEGTCNLLYSVDVCGDEIYGCTDPNAINYDANATIDDGSCFYDDGCDYNTLTMYMEDSFGDGWNGAYYVIISEDGLVLVEGTFNQGTIDLDILCLPDGCYYIYVGGGQFDSEISWYLEMNGVVLASGGATTETSFGINSDCDGIGGCTNPNACNYNPDAQTDDGSCTYPGCTDPEANNYDPNAGCGGEDYCIYDEPCEATPVTITMEDSFGDGWNGAYYVIISDSDITLEGTLDSGSVQIDELCLEDGCYLIFVGGGSFDSEISWSVSIGDEVVAYGGAPAEAFFGVNSDCGSVYGCTDAEACNYNANADIDDQSCTYPGCMDPEANNYDPEAECGGEDYCTYDTPCEANEVTLWINTQAFGGEVSWNLLSSGGELIASGDGYNSNSEYFIALCLEDDCYTFEMFDSFGDGWNGGFYMFFGEDGLIEESSLLYGDYELDIISINSDCQTDGCTDPTALNFDASAEVEDGSCLFGPGGMIGFAPDFGQAPGFNMTASLAPNPVVSTVKLFTNNLQKDQDVEIVIIDLTGKMVYQESYGNESEARTFELNLETLASGLYFLQLRNGAAHETVELVVQR